MASWTFKGQVSKWDTKLFKWRLLKLGEEKKAKEIGKRNSSRKKQKGYVVGSLGESTASVPSQCFRWQLLFVLTEVRLLVLVCFNHVFLVQYDKTNSHTWKSILTLSKNQLFAQMKSTLNYWLLQECSDALMCVLGYTGWHSPFRHSARICMATVCHPCMLQYMCSANSGLILVILGMTFSQKFITAVTEIENYTFNTCSGHQFSLLRNFSKIVVTTDYSFKFVAYVLFFKAELSRA